MIFKRQREPHTDSIRAYSSRNVFHEEQFRTSLLHTNWSVAPQCIPRLVWGFLMRCRSDVESLMQSRSITPQSGNWNIKTAAPSRTKKRKCARNMKNEILPNSAIPLSQCSNFLSEEIEKCLSLPSYFNACQRSLGDKKMENERERDSLRRGRHRSNTL